MLPPARISQKVSVLIHLVHQVTVEGTFEKLCLIQIHTHTHIHTYTHTHIHTHSEFVPAKFPPALSCAPEVPELLRARQKRESGGMGWGGVQGERESARARERERERV